MHINIIYRISDWMKISRRASLSLPNAVEFCHFSIFFEFWGPKFENHKLFSEAFWLFVVLDFWIQRNFYQDLFCIQILILKPFEGQNIQIEIKEQEKNQTLSGVVFDLDAIKPNNMNDNFRNFSAKNRNNYDFRENNILMNIIVTWRVSKKVISASDRKPFLRNDFSMTLSTEMWNVPSKIIQT